MARPLRTSPFVRIAAGPLRLEIKPVMVLAPVSVSHWGRRSYVYVLTRSIPPCSNPALGCSAEDWEDCRVHKHRPKCDSLRSPAGKQSLRFLRLFTLSLGLPSRFSDKPYKQCNAVRGEHQPSPLYLPCIQRASAFLRRNYSSAATISLHGMIVFAFPTCEPRLWESCMVRE